MSAEQQATTAPINTATEEETHKVPFFSLFFSKKKTRNLYFFF